MSYASETLKFVNKVRKTHGLSPLSLLKQGHKTSHDLCPVSRSISHGSALSVETGSCTLLVECKMYDLPKSVRAFIASFDEGRQPGYIKR